MGRVAAATSRIYVDEHNFSGRTNKLALEVDVNLPEVTCFGDTAPEYVEGLYNGKMPIGGFFDGADDNYDEEMFTDLSSGVEHLVGIYPGQDASHGDFGYEMQCKLKQDAIPLEIAGAVILNVVWQGSGPIVRSTVLCNGAVVATGAVTNSNKNWGATAAGEVFVGILRILSLTASGGAPSIVVEIEESSDDAVGDPYAQLIAFAAKAAVGSERKSVATATEAYKRVNVTTLTDISTATILVVIGKEQGVS